MTMVADGDASLERHLPPSHIIIEDVFPLAQVQFWQGLLHGGRFRNKNANRPTPSRAPLADVSNVDRENLPGILIDAPIAQEEEEQQFTEEEQIASDNSEHQQEDDDDDNWVEALAEGLGIFDEDDGGEQIIGDCGGGGHEEEEEATGSGLADAGFQAGTASAAGHVVSASGSTDQVPRLFFV